MQAFYPERFEHKISCTEADWLRWLPQAQAAAPRVIGLIRIPVLRVSFRFAGLDDAQRYAFMKHFDLCMQRGGG